MNKEKTDYFIKIANPKDMRRTVLENSRDVLKVLQGYEEFRKIRKERTQLIDSFKVQTNELRSMVLQLKKMMPKATVKETKKAVVVKQPSVPKQPQEFKKLEQELAAIEAQLNQL